jgi:hypothetical protein
MGGGALPFSRNGSTGLDTTRIAEVSGDLPSGDRSGYYRD